jgi:hypothetical protein
MAFFTICVSFGFSVTRDSLVRGEVQHFRQLR